MPVLLRARGVLRVSGPDAAALLQSQVTADVHALRAGPAAFLTPKGRVDHLAHLVAEAPDSFLVETAAEGVPGLLRRLKMYKLRSKVELEDLSSEFGVFAAQGDEAACPEGALADWSCPSALGRRVVAPLAAVAAPEEGDIAEAEIREGVAAAPMAGGIPLECNLDLLDAISFTKGCYMGQELVARTFFKGTVRKRLLPFSVASVGDGETPGGLVGENLRTVEGEAKAGRVVLQRGDLGMALVRLEHLDAPLMVNGQTVSVLRPSWWQELDPETGKAPR